ncbi:hypothetical protein T09_3332 [Trichinella sp. T9]|uniref:RPA-interacting protein C-terminal domain-containing protein n=1 Tax=Trichinella murrelli TaxID=144512 RepID=A0A0V0TZ87_9BILA|nr:hypothetical protein T05_1435 [Trichinella murrelli]KRX44333.1 hypothetical protein T05_3320 [Trichinella murrelli]KRX53164.1 hypothetical protein T09_3332 [Trichinella sp. T9]
MFSTNDLLADDRLEFFRRCLEPIRNKIRQEFFNQLALRRNQAINDRRNDHTASYVSPSSQMGSQNECGESSCDHVSASNNMDTDDLSSVQLCDFYGEQLNYENAMLEANVSYYENNDSYVICPICLLCQLQQQNDSIVCECGFKIHSLQNRPVSLSALKNSIFSSLILHEGHCSAQPEFVSVAYGDGIELYLKCSVFLRCRCSGLLEQRNIELYFMDF